MARDAARAANPEAEDASLAAVGKLLWEAMYTGKVDSCGVKAGLVSLSGEVKVERYACLGCSGVLCFDSGT